MSSGIAPTLTRSPAGHHESGRLLVTRASLVSRSNIEFHSGCAGICVLHAGQLADERCGGVGFECGRRDRNNCLISAEGGTFGQYL